MARAGDDRLLAGRPFSLRCVLEVPAIGQELGPQEPEPTNPQQEPDPISTQPQVDKATSKLTGAWFPTSPQDPIETAIMVWLSRLEGRNEQEFISAVQRYHRLFGTGVLRHGDGCTGTGIAAKYEHSLCCVLNRWCGLNFTPEYSVAIEKNSNKQDVIREQHPDLKLLMQTLAELDAIRAVTSSYM